MADETVILDACCTLNLSATSRAADCLRPLPYRFVVGSRARVEAQWLVVPGTEERERVDLQPLIDHGLLIEERPEDPAEIETYVSLATRMGDGEAEAAALATCRGYALATDDRKARKILAERFPALQFKGTLELLHEWQARVQPSGAEMTELLRRISERASYRPSRLDPLRSWWADLLGEE